MPFPFGPQMHRFGPQMGPGPQFQQPPMNPQFSPMNMPPRFPPQFMPPQEQMNMQNNMPPLQMNFQPPQQVNFQAPPMRMPFQPQNMQFQPQNMQFQPQQQLPPVPQQQMSPPRPEVPQFRLINPAPQQQQLPNFERPQQQEIENSAQQPELRIQLRRIQIPGPISDIFPFLNNVHNMDQDAKELDTARQNVQIQQMPLAVALSKVGITPDDLRNIQRMAEEKFQEHIRDLVSLFSRGQ
jgi:hypothetical protein